MLDDFVANWGDFFSRLRCLDFVANWADFIIKLDSGDFRG
jgi:hypothetical protein